MENVQMSFSALEDDVALRKLVSVYCSYVDDGDAERMFSLFAPKGRLVVYTPGSKVGVDAPLRQWEGIEGFSKLIGALGKSYVRWVHFLGNHWVDIAGDRASGETYCIASHLRESPEGNFEEVNLIRYQDVYVRTSEGWCFETRNACQQWGTVRPVNAAKHELDAVIHGR
jgi:hypothetical protein